MWENDNKVNKMHKRVMGKKSEKGGSEGVSMYTQTERESAPSTGNGKCKGPEVGARLAVWTTHGIRSKSEWQEQKEQGGQ